VSDVDLGKAGHPFRLEPGKVKRGPFQYMKSPSHGGSPSTDVANTACSAQGLPPGRPARTQAEAGRSSVHDDLRPRGRGRGRREGRALWCCRWASTSAPMPWPTRTSAAPPASARELTGQRQRRVVPPVQHTREPHPLALESAVAQGGDLDLRRGALPVPPGSRDTDGNCGTTPASCLSRPRGSYHRPTCGPGAARPRPPATSHPDEFDR
jgi:hypothetical protein